MMNIPLKQLIDTLHQYIKVLIFQLLLILKLHNYVFFSSSCSRRYYFRLLTKAVARNIQTSFIIIRAISFDDSFLSREINYSFWLEYTPLLTGFQVAFSLATFTIQFSWSLEVIALITHCFIFASFNQQKLHYTTLTVSTLDNNRPFALTLFIAVTQFAKVNLQS